MRGSAFFCGVAVLALTTVLACTRRLRTERFVWTPDNAAPPRRVPDSGACAGWESYVPDPNHPDHQPLRYLRVNFHVMDNAAGAAHRPPDSVRVFLRRLLELANAELDTNVRNWQSPDGTPTLPKRYRYVLTPQTADPADDGIYFHYDDSLYFYVSSGRYQNNYDRRVVQKYGTGLDSILNIFLQVHPRDSFISKTYHANGQGIALGNALKMAGVLESREGPDSFDGLLNHEIGHILGLSHAWMEDGCPDTKNHPNKCWEWSKDPPCSQLATNNMMDYNAYQIALTPCQIGKALALLAEENNPVRRCLAPSWCTFHPDRGIIIADSVAWTGARDLEGNLTIAPGGVLRLSCRLSMPPGGRITVQPGGRLWLDGCRLHNACGKSWQGIFKQQQDGIRGELRILRPPVLENIENR